MVFFTLYCRISKFYKILTILSNFGNNTPMLKIYKPILLQFVKFNNIQLSPLATNYHHWQQCPLTAFDHFLILLGIDNYPRLKIRSVFHPVSSLWLEVYLQGAVGGDVGTQEMGVLLLLLFLNQLLDSSRDWAIELKNLRYFLTILVIYCICWTYLLNHLATNKSRARLSTLADSCLERNFSDY